MRLLSPAQANVWIVCDRVGPAPPPSLLAWSQAVERQRCRGDPRAIALRAKEVRLDPPRVFIDALLQVLGLSCLYQNNSFLQNLYFRPLFVFEICIHIFKIL